MRVKMWYAMKYEKCGGLENERNLDLVSLFD